ARFVMGDLYVPIDFVTRILEPALLAASRGAAGGGAAATIAAAAQSGATPSTGAAGPVVRTTSTSGSLSVFPAAAPGSNSVILAPAATHPGDSPSAAAAGARDGLHTVVIDPGHGGDETGALGKSGVLEKEITLAIAKKLKALLDKQGELKVLLTRSDD